MKKSAYLKTKLQKLFLRSKRSGVLIISLLFCSVVSLAQNITIRGKVLKADGQPVAGASVTVKGTKNGTVCNDAG